jgi:ribonuclease HI/predicted RNA-binding Zn-ribbon protein involved in translation (DUF1610 family)
LQPHLNNGRISEIVTPEGNNIQQTIPTLPRWQSELLQNMTMQRPEEELKEEIKQHLKIASDGSVQGNRASFAWTIATATGTRLATGSAPAFGCKPTSYRAEAYGILSVLQFMNLISEQWGTIGTCHIVCDNEALVKQLNKTNEYTKTQPNQTMIAEWDILIEIWETMAKMDNIRIQHIKGHSDEKQPYEKLTLLQQLNVDADKMADQYIQDNWNKEYRWVSMMPTSGVQFNLPNGTITYQLKKQIKEASTTKQQTEYLCKKFGWEHPTFDLIAWEPHRRAINRHSTSKTTMVKFLNDLVPVGKVVNRYDKKYPAQCPSCDEAMETQEHLHQCPNQVRQQWREEFKDKMRRKMETYKTSKNIITLWIEGMFKGMLNEATTIEGTPDTRQIIEAQESIGWDQMIKGRIAKEWILHQKEAMGATATKKKNALTWATEMISLIFEQWLKLWKIRNEDRHGRDKATRKAAERKQAIRELRQMYEDHEQTQEEWILQRPLEEQETKTTYTIRAIISNYTPVLKGSHQTQLETG